MLAEVAVPAVGRLARIGAHFMTPARHFADERLRVGIGRFTAAQDMLNIEAIDILRPRDAYAASRQQHGRGNKFTFSGKVFPRTQQFRFLHTQSPMSSPTAETSEQLALGKE